MSTAIFGGFWDAPGCEEAVSVDTPVGEACFWCQETIASGDRGLLMHVIREGDSGQPVSRLEPIHRECHLRSVMGSWGHLMGTCHCVGGDEEDPPGMTPRQSALLVWDYVASGRIR